MYRINPLHRNVLITTDEVRFHVSTAHTLDSRVLQPAIIIAEERIVRPALGFDFYDSIRNQKNTVVTSLNKAALETQINESLEDGTETVTLAVGDIVNAREFLNASNLLLWDEYLWKLTAEAVRFVAIPQNYAELTSAGLVHNKPVASAMMGEGAATPELRTAKWMMDKALSDSIDPLTEAMHVWICNKRNNGGLFSAYTKTCSCNANGIAYARKTDILMNIYDDEPCGETIRRCCD